MKNKVSDLRNHLFVTLEQLLDKDDPMDIGRARAVSEVAQVIINSAKAETEQIKAIDQIKPMTDFFEENEPAPLLVGSNKK